MCRQLANVLMMMLIVVRRKGACRCFVSICPCTTANIECNPNQESIEYQETIDPFMNAPGFCHWVLLFYTIKRMIFKYTVITSWLLYMYMLKFWHDLGGRVVPLQICFLPFFSAYFASLPPHLLLGDLWLLPPRLLVFLYKVAIILSDCKHHVLPEFRSC